MGDYEVLALLGKGGTGEVSLAVRRNTNFRKLVVLKTLHSHFETDEESVEAFMDEARLAAHLNHPNIVQTFEVGLDDDRYFLAMDYLDGVPLNRLLQRLRRQERAVPEPIAAWVAREVLSGLHYAHGLESYDGEALNIVHRDVSPSNIFLSWDGTTKLIDFGIAKAAQRSTNTDSGVIKGKFAYIAPEQVTQSDIDGRADVFSLGVVLWEMLSGRRLRPHDNDVLTLQELMTETPPLLHEMADVDESLSQIVAQSLQDEAGARFASAEEMALALDKWLVARGEPVAKADVAALLGDTFAGEREQQQAMVHDCLKRLESSSVGSSEDLAAPPSQPKTRPPTPTLPFALVAFALAGIAWILVAP